MLRRSILVFVLCAGPACGDEPATIDPADAAPPDAAPGDGFTTLIQRDWSVPPGSEYCCSASRKRCRSVSFSMRAETPTPCPNGMYTR